MKQINLQNIKIHEITLAKEGDNYSIHAIYSLLDENGNEFGRKGRTIKNIAATQLQKDKLSAILSMIDNKLKLLEEL